MSQTTFALASLAWSLAMILVGAWAFGIAEGYLPRGRSRTKASLQSLRKLLWLFYVVGVLSFVRGIVALEADLVALFR